MKFIKNFQILLKQINFLRQSHLQFNMIIKRIILRSITLCKMNFSTSLQDEQLFESLFKKMKFETERYYDVQKILQDPEGLQKQRKNPESLRKQINQLSPLVSLYEELVALLKNIKDMNEMVEEVQDKEEKQFLKQQIKQLEDEKQSIKNRSIELLVPPDLYDDVTEVNLEFRPGAGGTQSSLFIEDLSNMIISYCVNQGWSVKTINAVKDKELKRGYKILVLKVKGEDVHKLLKCESGVHKVIRVPETEAKGRLHSSTVSMAVLPAIPFNFNINEKQIKYEFMRGSGPGGQSVNKTESACRATHIPTGMSVFIQEEKSQDHNKRRATQILKERIFEIEYQKNIENESKTRKSQVGTMDRSEKIRTYNYPQDRITDHRTKLTLYGMEEMMSGAYLEKFIKIYQQKIYEEKLELLLKELKGGSKASLVK